MKPQLVEVSWLDACVRLRSTSFKKAKKAGQLYPRRTVGFLAHKGKKKIVLAWTFDDGKASDGGGFDDLYTIPRKWVQKIRRLK